MVYEYEEICLAQVPVVLETPPPEQSQQEIAAQRKGKLPLLLRQSIAGLGLLAVLLSVRYWWPAGHGYLRQKLCGTTIGPRQAAAQELIREVLAGGSIPEALSVFCQEVVHAQD